MTTRSRGHVRIRAGCTVLISSAGRRVSLLRSFREAFATLGVTGRIIACDIGWTAPAMYVADDALTVPGCTDPAFAGCLTDICRRERVDLVVPTIDPELPVWAALRQPLADLGTVVAVSAPEVIDIAADKRMTNSHCRRHGLPCPRQATVAQVLGSPAAWTFPLIAKPVRGSASIGVRRLTGWPQLKAVSDEADIVVETLAPGSEYTVDVYVDRAGLARAPVPRRRLEVRAGEVSKAQVVRDAMLESLAVQTVRTLPGPYGPLNVQMFFDGRTASVIEINARFGGGYPLTCRAGGRYSEWLLREVLRGEAPPADPPIADRLIMLRWDDEVFIDGMAG